MKKQLATTLDVRVIKALKLSAIEYEVNVNDLLEALVCDAYNRSKDTVIDRLNSYQAEKESMLEYLPYSKA